MPTFRTVKLNCQFFKGGFEKYTLGTERVFINSFAGFLKERGCRKNGFGNDERYFLHFCAQSQYIKEVLRKCKNDNA